MATQKVSDWIDDILTAIDVVDPINDQLLIYDKGGNDMNKVTPNFLFASPPSIGGTTPTLGNFSPLESKGPAIVNAGFVGTVTATASTTVTFSSAADAILAGYSATNPTLGVTLISNALTRYIISWTNATTCIIDTAVTWAGTNITSVHFPIFFGVDSSGVLAWALLANGNLYFVGSVGIGVAESMGILRLCGGVPNLYEYITSSGNGGEFGLILQDNISSNAAQFTYNSATGENRIGGTKNYVFQTLYSGGAERIRITIDGDVGIGTTSPDYQLELSTDSAGKPGVGGLWTVVSDSRLKEDIQPADLDRCYEIIKNLPLKRFTWREDCFTEEQIKDRSGLGWIADDVKPIFPKATQAKTFTLPTLIPDGEEEYQERDFKTNEIVTKTRPKFRQEVIEDCLDLNAGQIYSAMYGALQKTMQLVEILTKRIDELESNRQGIK